MKVVKDDDINERIKLSVLMAPEVNIIERRGQEFVRNTKGTSREF